MCRACACVCVYAHVGRRRKTQEGWILDQQHHTTKPDASSHNQTRRNITQPKHATLRSTKKQEIPQKQNHLNVKMFLRNSCTALLLHLLLFKLSVSSGLSSRGSGTTIRAGKRECEVGARPLLHSGYPCVWRNHFSLFLKHVERQVQINKSYSFFFILFDPFLFMFSFPFFLLWAGRLVTLAFGAIIFFYFWKCRETGKNPCRVLSVAFLVFLFLWFLFFSFISGR